MTGSIDSQTLARALEMIRAGEEVSLSSVGGRYFETLVGRGGRLWIEELDEGQRVEREVTEPEAMRALTSHPDAVAVLLARPIWRRFFQVLVDGDRAQAKAALDATLGMPGYVAPFRFVYEAFLAWPEVRPSAQLREQLKSLVEQGMALRPLPAADASGGVAVTKKSIEYLTALGEMTGWPRSLYRHRADCYERVGNLQAALDDYLLEQKFHGNQQQRIQELRTALSKRGSKS